MAAWSRQAVFAAEAIVGGAYTNTIAGPYLRLAGWVDFLAWGGWAEVDTIRAELSLLMIRSHVGYAHAAGVRLLMASRLVDDFQNRTENWSVIVRHYHHLYRHRRTGGRRRQRSVTGWRRGHAIHGPQAGAKPMTTEAKTKDDDAKDGKTKPKPWRGKGQQILDALIEHVPHETERRPWQPGHALQIQGLGGMVSKERRHFTILGHGSYSNRIGGCRTLVADSLTTRTTRELTTSIGRGDDAPDVDVPWGTDSLTVDGDADITFGSRLILMSGFIDRNWNGGVMRLASMEGVICGAHSCD